MTIQALIESQYVALLGHPVVRSVDLARYTVNRLDSYLRARCILRNGDFLEIALHVTVSRNAAIIDDYRYQWMDAGRTIMYRRWDNTPHFPSLPGAPHHCHIGAQVVQPSAYMNVSRLLAELDQLIG